MAFLLQSWSVVYATQWGNPSTGHTQPLQKPISETIARAVTEGFQSGHVTHLWKLKKKKKKNWLKVNIPFTCFTPLPLGWTPWRDKADEEQGLFVRGCSTWTPSAQFPHLPFLRFLPALSSLSRAFRWEDSSVSLPLQRQQPSTSAHSLPPGLRHPALASLGASPCSRVSPAPSVSLTPMWTRFHAQATSKPPHFLHV